jgi:hypothetical protein
MSVYDNWATSNGVSNSSGTLTKTASDSWSNACNISTDSYRLDTTDHEFIIGNPNTGNQSLGLDQSIPTGLGQQKYAWQLGGYAEVREDGVLRYQNTNPQPTDTFEIKSISGTVSYYENSSLVYTSLAAPSIHNYYLTSTQYPAGAECAIQVDYVPPPPESSGTRDPPPPFNMESL